MTLQIKICGLTNRDGVAAALEAGADFLGFVHFSKSPRHVTPAQARVLAGPARARARLVSVVVDPDDDLVAEIARELAPDFIQLHGREGPDRVRAVAAALDAQAIKAIPVSAPSDLGAAAIYEPVAGRLMFDARPVEGSALPGGTGARFDWSLLAGRTFSRPWFLAGGLTPDNVAEAIATSGAGAVDVSSGVEKAPGLKDPGLVAAFIRAARRAWAEIEVGRT